MTGRRQRQCGWAAISGAVLAIVGDGLVLASSGSVPSDQMSYPLTPHEFQVGQVYFALTQLLITAGIVALVRSGAVWPSRTARAFGRLATLGIAMTVLGELALIPVADQPTNSAGASAATTFYGVAILLTDVGLIGFGLLAVRQGRWPRGWRLLPLLLGLFQLMVASPVALAFGFESLAGYTVIALSDLLIAAIGTALVRQSQPHAPATAAPVPAPRST